MLKRSEVVALTRNATRRVMNKQVGLFPPSKVQIERLSQLKKLKEKAKTVARQLVKA